MDRQFIMIQVVMQNPELFFLFLSLMEIKLLCNDGPQSNEK
jgi:hypothetical protein